VHEGVEPGEFIDGDDAAFGRELVVAAAFVVAAGGPVGGLHDESCVEEAVERAVERPRAHADGPVAQLLDPAHEGVAVEFAVEEGQDDVQRCGGEWLRSWHCRILIYRMSIVKARSFGGERGREW
jgi:hypothetical protein